MLQTLVDNDIVKRGSLDGGELDITRTMFVAGKDGLFATHRLYDAFFKAA